MPPANALTFMYPFSRYFSATRTEVASLGHSQ
jgi:hypothetical protein